MKLLLFTLLLLMGFNANAQDFSGNYASEYTSFRDNQNSENNFQEVAKFNIAISFEDEDKGRVAIQDPRIPKKILIYKVEQFLEKIKRNEIFYFIYQAVSQHPKKPIQTKIIFYQNKAAELNLMVSDDESSQVFHDLKKAKYTPQ